MDPDTQTATDQPPAIRRAVRDSTIVRVLIAAGVVALLVFVVLRVNQHDHHHGGDPGGKIMAALSTADAAVPPDAVVAYRNDDGPRWDSCDGRDGTFGWNDVVYQVGFTSDRADADLVARADAALVKRGWTAHGIPTPVNGRLVDHWTRSVPGGSATATARLDRTGDGSWILLAIAPQKVREQAAADQGCPVIAGRVLSMHRRGRTPGRCRNPRVVDRVRACDDGGGDTGG